MSRTVQVRHGSYRDSVTLLQVSRRLAERPGVDRALVAMATPINLDLLAGLGFSTDPVADTTPADLIVAIEAIDPATLEAALVDLDVALATAEPAERAGAALLPARTTGAALRRTPARLALVSVPGPYAAVEAMDALAAGADVMIFSDNMSVADEIALKDEAGRRGLLVMGPDCGTAVLGGVGLGFANVVRPGPVGVVAASGTGAQQLCCLLDAADVGVRSVLGVGGRDLSAAVAGRSTRQALAALDADPGTELIVVVSKPPDPRVADEIRRFADRLATPTVFGFVGPGRPDLSAVAADVLAAVGREPVGVFPEWPAPDPRPPRPGALRGLFSGGTICEEATVIASAALGPIRSNVPIDPAWQLGPDLRADGHLTIDYGDDRFTRGRPHPMIDWSLRLERIATEAADPTCAVLLLDVVLGHGAHPDPAALLAPAIAAARDRARGAGRDLAVVISLCGTRGDPQGLTDQAHRLRDAGASVHLSNAAAARAASALLEPGAHPAPTSVGTGTGPLDPTGPLNPTGPVDPSGPPITPVGVEPSGVVTAGVALLADALVNQAVTVEPVDWRPPVPGTEAAITRLVGDPRRTAANAEAVRRLTSARPHWVGVRPAREVLGLEPGEFLHAGPPIGWAEASGPLRGALLGAIVYEGLAESIEAAERLAAAGRIRLAPCHSRATVGPMAGVVSPSMPLVVIHDAEYGGTAYCTLNEGLGQVLRYGAYGPAVLDRLRWIEAVLGPLLAAAVRRHGPLDVGGLIAQALQMGDEGHNRNRAGTSLLLRELAADLVGTDAPRSEVAAVLAFIAGNDHFALNLVMPASKVAADTARGIPGATMVVAMARNGTEFGVQTAGTGDAWFTAPAGVPDGLYLPGYGLADANPDIGDSTITETAGIGGFAMAAAPAIVRFVGGTVADAVEHTRTMYEITLAEHPAYQIPTLGFRGTPVGIDPVLVARTGIVPVVNTGIAGRVAGTGQVGAGLVTPPMDGFVDAVRALAAAVPG